MWPSDQYEIETLGLDANINRKYNGKYEGVPFLDKSKLRISRKTTFETYLVARIDKDANLLLLELATKASFIFNCFLFRLAF